MSPNSVERATEDAFSSIDEYARNHPDGLIYYSTAYARFVQAIADCQYDVCVTRNEDGAISGILPLFTKTSAVGKKVINSSPFYGSNGWILANNRHCEEKLCEFYHARLENEDVVAATVIENPLTPTQIIPEHDLLDTRIAQITHLNELSDEELFRLYDGSARRNVRKAKKEGVSVKIENESWPFLKKTHVDNMSAIGGNAKPDFFFDCFDQYFKPGIDYNIFCATKDGDCIAALLLLYFGDTVEYFVPVTVEKHRNSQPLSLIIHEAMIHARDNGYRKWNWGGTWKTQEGVYRFKRKFGASESEYRYFVRLLDESVCQNSPEQLLADFPFFFVVPFSQLENK